MSIYKRTFTVSSRRPRSSWRASEAKKAILSSNEMTTLYNGVIQSSCQYTSAWSMPTAPTRQPTWWRSRYGQAGEAGSPARASRRGGSGGGAGADAATTPLARMPSIPEIERVERRQERGEKREERDGNRSVCGVKEEN